MRTNSFTKIAFLFCLFCMPMVLFAGPDENRLPFIRGVVFCTSSSVTSYPITDLGTTNSLRLQFDDLEGGIKAYSYTYQLCDANWQPAQLSTFDFLKGYTANRITNYQMSSIAATSYTHYTLSLPESNMLPTKSGNYILKVFLNGDTTRLAFSRRLLIVDNKADISLELQQPYDVAKMRTHQKLQFTVNTSALQVTNPDEQIKVAVLQNYRWDNAIARALPAFMRGSSFEYNGERDFVIPAGKEYRWLDLSSFRFLSDRMKSVDRSTTPFRVNAIPDMERMNTQYLPYQDYNGFFYPKASEQIDVSYQGDYGWVHFAYQNYDKTAFPDQNVYIVGQFNNYNCDEKSVMKYNADSGYYECYQLLKQGYYNYIYVTRPINNPSMPDNADVTEGNYWETENDYIVLVYYRSLNNRYDELVGYKTVNTRK